MIKELSLVLIISFVLSTCTLQVANKDIQEADNMSQISLKTEDGFDIEGSYYKGKTDGKGIILLHMLGRNRHDWDNFALTLQKEGYSVVSIDMRGHGESQGNFKSFSENDFNNIKLDAKSAKEFLTDKGIINFTIIGASIGANTALNYAVEDKEISSIILLSPGLDYRGVKIEETIKKYNNAILILVSREDSYSADSSEALFSSAKSKKQIKIFQDLGHGTQMLASKEIQTTILNWLMETLK